MDFAALHNRKFIKNAILMRKRTGSVSIMAEIQYIMVEEELLCVSALHCLCLGSFQAVSFRTGLLSDFNECNACDSL